MLLIVKSLGTIVLGLAVFFGFMLLLLLNNFSNKLLDSNFYTLTISGNDTYNRIYNQVLVDKELEITRDLLGNVEVVSDEDVVELLKQVLPPSYLQSQVERNIERTVDYLNEDLDTLELYVEMGPPLDNIQSVLFGYIDQRIDEIEEEAPGNPECSPRVVTHLAREYQARWAQLADGHLPGTVPSLKAIDRRCRTLMFEATFDRTIADTAIDQRARQRLMESRSELRQEFIEGDAHGVLKASARPLATPIMDDAIEQVRKGLGEGDRIDLIDQLVDWNDQITEEELRYDLDRTRRFLNGSQNFGKPAALAMLIAGLVLMGLLHYPSLTGAMRWPGLTLLLTGAAFLGVSKFLESRVPEWVDRLVVRGAEEAPGVPASVTDLAGDLLISFARQLTDGFAGPSITVLVIGGLLFGGSFFVFVLRPLLPRIR